MVGEQKAILQVAIKVAKEAGKVLKKYFHTDFSIARKKGIGNIVTIADKESEEVIVKTITRSFPDHNILGEEGTAQKSNSPYLWSIDPCDGTLPYSNKLPYFAVSIGIHKEDQPYVGVAYLPFGLFGEEELYTAVKGKGSFLNGKKIHVSSKNDMQDSIVGFDYAYVEREDRIKELLLRVVSHVRGTITLQWAVGPLCFLARGLLDGYIHKSLLHWDIAAATLIIEEAGGMVTDLSGRPLVWETGKTFDYYASNGKIHKALLSKITP